MRSPPEIGETVRILGRPGCVSSETTVTEHCCRGREDRFGTACGAELSMRDEGEVWERVPGSSPARSERDELLQALILLADRCKKAERALRLEFGGHCRYSRPLRRANVLIARLTGKKVSDAR